MVVSSPSAPDLTSLLTGYVGRDGGQQGADGIAAMDTAMTDIGADGTATMDMDITPLVKDPVDDNVKSQKKRNKKSKVIKRGKIIKAQPQLYKPQNELLRNTGRGSNILCKGLQF